MQDHPLTELLWEPLEENVAPTVRDETENILKPTWFNEVWFDDVCHAINDVVGPLEDQLYEPTEVSFP